MKLKSAVAGAEMWVLCLTLLTTDYFHHSSFLFYGICFLLHKSISQLRLTHVHSLLDCKPETISEYRI